jgi:hypothetical protein
MLRILQDTVHRADLDALGRFVVTDTFGAQSRVDHVDLVPLADGAVRALRLAHVAVDAFIGDVK